MKKKFMTTSFNMKKTIFAVVMASASLFICSCSKPDISKPVNTSQVSDDQTTAVKRTTPAPGNYTVGLYVNDNDTSTTDFTGYVFTFKATGVLTAKLGNTTYTGKWESKDNGTELKLDIDGTPPLHEIDKSWNVIKLTNLLINLNDPEHGDAGRDVLIFNRIK
jgi:hypothetical protein